MSYLGIDIGTTGCKAVLFDGEGRELSASYQEYPVRVPEPGRAELDSDQVIEACFTVIAEAVNSVSRHGVSRHGAAGRGAAEPVEALGIASQGEAFIPVGRKGAALGRAMVSSDSRAAAIAAAWPEAFGRSRLYQITGHTAHPMFTLFKLLWLKAEEPEVWQAAERFHCFEDLLQLRLGVESPAMGWPLAGRTMLFDVRRHDWSPEILDAAGLEPDRLARALPSGTAAGTVGAKAASQLGLPPGVVVVTGGHDQPCGALGAGALAEGTAMYSAGTVDCICPAFGRPVLTEELYGSNLCTYDHTAPGMYTTVAFSLTGGNILQWYRNEFAGEERRRAAETGADVYDLILASAGREPSRLLTLPYFTPTGTPYFDSRTAGAVVGFRLDTGRGELLRSLLEGVAFEMRLNLEILERSGIAIDELRLVGGGAKSPVMAGIKADVIGRPVTAASVKEAGCLGAALLACSAHTGTAIPELVSRWVKTAEVFEPDPGRTARYAEQYDRYKRLYSLIRELDRDL